MNFFHKLSPEFIPTHVNDPTGLQAMRERILQVILLIATIVGLPLVIMASIGGIAEGEYYLPYVYAVIYLPVFTVTMVRSLPYRLRGHTLTFLVFLLALSELIESGQMGEVRMMLMAFVALTAILFSFWDIAISMLMGLATIIGVSIYVSVTPVPFIPALMHVREGTSWGTSSLSFIMLTGLIAGPITTIINGLNSNLKRQAELAHKIAEERDSLGERIRERTSHMEHRMTQLRTAANISRTISALSDPEILIQQIVDLIKERFDLYYAGIFLLDSTRQNAVLRSGTGDAGKKMRALGHQLSVGGSSMIGWCISNRKARIALDVGTEAVRFSNPNLPMTRSELALPIMAHDRVLGAMTVQSESPNAFDEDDITILEGVADSLAIALENDRLFNETRSSLEEIRALNREYLQRAWAETIETYGELSYDYQSSAPIDESRPGNTVQIPLLLRDEVIGQISLEMDHAKLSEDEASFVENVTTQTAIALENARLLHETERRAVQEQKLNELTTRFSRALSIDEILRAAAQELGQLPAVAEVSVQLNPGGGAGKSKPLSSLIGDGNGKERAS